MPRAVREISVHLPCVDENDENFTPMTRRSNRVKHSSGSSSESMPATSRTTRQRSQGILGNKSDNLTSSPPKIQKTTKTMKKTKKIEEPKPSTKTKRTVTVEKVKKSKKNENLTLSALSHRLTGRWITQGGHLPCREGEFENTMTKVQRALFDGTGGSIYMSGVPGTGKTATVLQVVDTLKRGKSPSFHLVMSNGMHVTDPADIYTNLYHGLVECGIAMTGGRTTVAAQEACRRLDRFFTSNAGHDTPVLMVVDELDRLCTRSQDVLYKLIDWSYRPEARLTVLTIANTLDLPERLLTQRVASRLGVSRITFQPYSHEQIESIIFEKAGEEYADLLNRKAVEFVARKVGAVTGDLRKAIDMLAAAIDIAVEEGSDTVETKHATSSANRLLSKVNLHYIRALDVQSALVMRAAAQACLQSGTDMCSIDALQRNYIDLCTKDDVPEGTSDNLTRWIARLCDTHLMTCFRGARFDAQRQIRVNIDAADLILVLSG